MVDRLVLVIIRESAHEARNLSSFSYFCLGFSTAWHLGSEMEEAETSGLLKD